MPDLNQLREVEHCLRLLGPIHNIITARLEVGSSNNDQLSLEDATKRLGIYSRRLKAILETMSSKDTSK